jgi:hypothetical protein
MVLPTLVSDFLSWQDIQTLQLFNHEAPEKGVNFIQEPFTIGRLINKIREFQIKVQIILFRNRLV